MINYIETWIEDEELEDKIIYLCVGDIFTRTFPSYTTLPNYIYHLDIKYFYTIFHNETLNFGKKERTTHGIDTIHTDIFRELDSYKSEPHKEGRMIY